MAWWNNSYLFRRELFLTTFSDSSPAYTYFDIRPSDFNVTKLKSNNSLRSDEEDLEVIYESADATPSYTVIGRSVSTYSGGNGGVAFYNPIATPYTGKFYIYYGNSDLDNQPTRPTADASLQPRILVSDPAFTFTRPNEDWINGESVTTGARATFAIEGDGGELKFATGPDMGSVEVHTPGVNELSRSTDTDGSTLDLYSKTEGTQLLTFALSELENGLLSQTISVSDSTNPSSSGNKVKIIDGLSNYGAGGTMGLEEVRLENWTTYVGGGI